MNVELKLVADEIFFRYIKPLVKFEYEISNGYKVYPGEYLDCLLNLKDKVRTSLKNLTYGITNEHLKRYYIHMFANEIRDLVLVYSYRNGYCDDTRMGIRDRNMDFIYDMVHDYVETMVDSNFKKC